MNYLPFGLTRSSTGSSPTDMKFTGQRLDTTTGLYYYNARYYDPQLGRFISPDSIVQDFTNPQTLNRYAYCSNNPLKYTDPSGHFWDYIFDAFSIAFDVKQFVEQPTSQNAQILALDIVLGVIPSVPAVAGIGAKMGKTFIKSTERSTELAGLGEKSIKITQQMDNIAKDANVTIMETGAVGGILKHTYFRQKVEALKIQGLDTEKSYIGGKKVDYGTKGSIRVDAVLKNEDGTFTVWDLKTGNAELKEKRVLEIQKAVGGKDWEKVTVIEVK